MRKARSNNHAAKIVKEFIDHIIKQPVNWLSNADEDAGIVVSTRIRLARNIAGYPFPKRASAELRRDVFNLTTKTVRALPGMKNAVSVSMDDLDDADKQVLLERHLISHEHRREDTGRGLMVSRSEHLSFMINEEDHIRIQLIRPGLKLHSNWKDIDLHDDQLCCHLRYAFQGDLGFLTACPTNVGTGLRASVMMHLPGLVLNAQIKPIVNALTKMGFAVRGLFGEGSEHSGNFFQISNHSTLGESEREIVTKLENVVRRILEHENNARYILLRDNPTEVFDVIGRAYGQLSHTYKISSEEALAGLSALRLAVDLKLARNLERKLVNEILIQMQPGHLQKQAKRRLEPRERDSYRAKIIRDYMTQYRSAPVESQ